MSVIWHNSTFIADGPVFTAHDRIRLGECVFNTMLAIDGAPVHADLHFEKLRANAQAFFGHAPETTGLAEITQDLLARNEFTKGRYGVNCIITQGGAGIGLRPPENPDFQVVLRAFAAPENTAPVHAVIAQTVRRNEGSPLSRFKCGNYGDNIIGLREADSRGANEALLLNNKGHVACATAANIVACIDGALITPPLEDGVQNGVTRTLLLQKFPVEEHSLTAQELLTRTQGIYLINSLRGAVPLVGLEGQALPAPTVPIDKDFHLK